MQLPHFYWIGRPSAALGSGMNELMIGQLYRRPGLRRGGGGPSPSTLVGPLLLILAAVSIGASAWADDGSARTPPPLIDDPRQDGWRSEVLQDAAAAQLKRVARFLTDATATEKLEGLVTDDFSCGDLRPTRLQNVFQDRSLRVLRPESTLETNSRFQGIDGLQLELRQLVSKPLTDARASFKVFRIDSIGDSTFTTRQFLTLVGRIDETNREVHATWRCRWREPSSDANPRLISLAVEDYEEILVPRDRATLFSDCTEAVLGDNSSFHDQLVYGLDHWNNRVLRVDTDGMQGLAVGDANGDGLDDVYICQISPLPNRLFVQNPGGTATDRSADAGVDWQEPSHSALFVDLDNDGDQDLLVSTVAALLMMENDGHGVFALRWKVPEARDAYSLCAADYDQDGDLDVFACVYLAKARRRQILAAPVPFHDARNGGRNVLVRNDGSWRFEDATRTSGLEDEATRRSFASSWEDYDNDGDLDLYVANDYGRNNLFRNDGGRFTDVAAAAGVEDQSFGMSASWGDFNRDGWMDLYVSNMFSAAGNRIVFQDQFKGMEDEDVRRKFQYMARGNSLFQNNGQGGFLDVSQDAAIMMGLWAWGSQFVDLNNDGREDLVVANGYLTRSDPHDL